MNPCQHATNTHWLGRPADMTAEECTALPITRFEYQDGTKAVASFWRPTLAELQLLNEGKPVRLIALGQTHPPLLLGVDGDGVL